MSQLFFDNGLGAVTNTQVAMLCIFNGLRASARANHPVLLVFSAIFFVTERVS